MTSYLSFTILAIISLPLLKVAAEPTISENQEKWIKHYKKQKALPTPGEMLLNTDSEPDLTEGFMNLYNGKDLDGWVARGGDCLFEARGETIVGTCVPKSPSTYLSTVKDDYTDFVFTGEIKWEVDGNTGFIFRGATRIDKDKKTDKEKETVYGPQVEMEEMSRQRFWSGGIYRQSCGGWAYPLWLEEHSAVRKAINYDEWNRVTVLAKGSTVKTWVNGIPAAHWTTTKYLKGFFSLQVHSGGKGTILFRNLKVKELKIEKENSSK